MDGHQPAPPCAYGAPYTTYNQTDSLSPTSSDDNSTSQPNTFAPRFCQTPHLSPLLHRPSAYDAWSPTPPRRSADSTSATALPHLMGGHPHRRQRVSSTHPKANLRASRILYWLRHPAMHSNAGLPTPPPTQRRGDATSWTDTLATQCTNDAAILPIPQALQDRSPVHGNTPPKCGRYINPAAPPTSLHRTTSPATRPYPDASTHRCRWCASQAPTIRAVSLRHNGAHVEISAFVLHMHNRLHYLFSPALRPFPPCPTLMMTIQHLPHSPAALLLLLPLLLRTLYPQRSYRQRHIPGSAKSYATRSSPTPQTSLPITRPPTIT